MIRSPAMINNFYIVFNVANIFPQRKKDDVKRIGRKEEQTTPNKTEKKCAKRLRKRERGRKSKR